MIAIKQKSVQIHVNNFKKRYIIIYNLNIIPNHLF
jgi:hypothetical protein